MTTPKIRFRKIADLNPDPANARTHSADQIDQLVGSIARFGWTNPVLSDDLIRAGHGRVLAATQIYAGGGTIYLAPGEANGGAAIPKGTVPVMDCTGWTEEERRAYALADNQLALQAGWNTEILFAQIEELKATDFDMDIIGFDQAAIDALAAGGGDAPAVKKQPHGSLADEFLIAPFSVLNAREGWWQDRKRVWLSLGIESEIGRGSDGKSARTFGQDLMRGEHVVGDATAFEDKDWIRQKQASGELTSGLASAHSGTSIFDPVLCELAYRWFSPKAGRVLDPFAGGSVRGIVAAALGRHYTGIDLRPEQIEANAAQWPGVKAQIGDDLFDPEWIVGDSRDVLSARDADSPVGDAFDFIFSCPPYGDLEVYSDDPADISTMSVSEFDNAYRSIIARAVARLADDRFACFVVGDYRDKRGIYANFVSRTIAAFEAAGAPLYNEAILITTAGSLPIRAAKQFRATRKLGKTHQNVLVFVKGDPRAATKACGDVDVSAAMDQFGD